MRRRGITLNYIEITGGEPFLHPDLLGFARAMRQYSKVAVASNLFWLKNEASIEEHSELLSLIDMFLPSIYPDTNKEWLVRKLEKAFPELNVFYRRKRIFTSFEFTKEPMLVKGKGCGQGVYLLINGRLARCPVGAFGNIDSTVTEEFLKNRNNVFFDLYGDGDIKEWREKWPLDSCSYCTLWKDDKVQWQELDQENE